MAHVHDLWTAVSKDTGRKRRTDRWGKGLRWQVEWVNGEGKKRRKSFEYKELAEKHCADMNAERHRGVYRRGSGRETFEEVAEQWLAAQLHLRETSATAARTRLTNTVYPTLGRRSIAQITSEDMQAAVGQWAIDYAPSTVRTAFGYASSVFSWAVRAELIPRSPCVKIRLPRAVDARVVPLADKTVADIADAMAEHWQAAVWVVAATGMRGGELRGLTWDRVHETHLRIDRQITGTASSAAPVLDPLKTASSVRSVAIGPNVLALLREHRRIHGEGPERLVFSTEQGRALGRRNMADAWQRARMAVPQAGPGWHQLRHYHASRLIGAGLSPVAVAARLGHKDPSETLATYAHLWPAEDEIMAGAGEAIVAPALGRNVVALRRQG